MAAAKTNAPEPAEAVFADIVRLIEGAIECVLVAKYMNDADIIGGALLGMSGEIKNG